MSRQRIVRVSAGASEAPSEVHVAGGSPTLVSLDVRLGPEGPRLQSEHGHVRLVPVEGSSFLILPSVDLPKGERLLVSVPLEQGGLLSLVLSSVRDEVDTQVGLLLHASAAVEVEEGAGDMARLLNAARAEPVEMAPPGMCFLNSGDSLVRFRSVLRLDHYVFVSFLLWERRRSVDVSKRLLLRSVIQEGSVVPLPLLRVSSMSSASYPRQYTFVSVLPEGASTLEVVLRGEGDAEGSLSLPLARSRSTP
ncbi:hypothetical protein D187_000146 [Cystobacter fuscus DSM 2262]|uniref:Uncharacterized protein n=2 Tax=Cystobacter fuscus TaxID=43 RepID=S9QTU1_CYSF2|nr:hypothetical protein D187_000146 [Cystobacter fuscus DSM 2262]